MQRYSVSVSPNGNKIILDLVKKDSIVGDLENWTHNIERDFMGQAARCLQGLVVKLALAVERALISPKSNQCFVKGKNAKGEFVDMNPRLSYIEPALKYLIIIILGIQPISDDYYWLVDFDKKRKYISMNSEANSCKHNIKESRFSARNSGRVFNMLVNKLAIRLNLPGLKKFVVDVSKVKKDTAPTTNFSYLKPIEGEPDYDQKKKAFDRMFDMWKRTLVTPDDYYIQLKAIKYQRDVVLSEELDKKWAAIKRDHKDRRQEFNEIVEAIGDHTFKINYLINNLAFNHISGKAVAVANKYLNEEIVRNKRIIEYTQYVIDGCKAGKWKIITSAGRIHTDTTSLEEYIVWKNEQNDKLREKLNSIKNL